MTEKLKKAAVWILLTAGALVMMFPFIWMLATSLKTLPEATAIPPTLFPTKAVFANYAEAFTMAPFGRYLFNSILVAGLGTLLTLVITVLAAYAFTIFEFPGKSSLFFCCLATMMIPAELLIIQNFITVSKLHWVNTFQGIIIPTIASGFYIYMMREYFLQTPLCFIRPPKSTAVRTGAICGAL